MAIQQSEEVIAGGGPDDYPEARHVVLRGKTSVRITHHSMGVTHPPIPHDSDAGGLCGRHSLATSGVLTPQASLVVDQGLCVARRPRRTCLLRPCRRHARERPCRLHRMCLRHICLRRTCLLRPSRRHGHERLYRRHRTCLRRTYLRRLYLHQHRASSPLTASSWQTDSFRSQPELR